MTEWKHPIGELSFKPFRKRLWGLWHLIIKGETLTFSAYVYSPESGVNLWNEELMMVLLKVLLNCRIEK